MRRNQDVGDRKRDAEISFGDDLFLGWSPEEIGIYDF